MFGIPSAKYLNAAYSRETILGRLKECRADILQQYKRYQKNEECEDLFRESQYLIMGILRGKLDVNDFEVQKDLHRFFSETVPAAIEEIRDQKALDIDNDINPKTGEKRG